MKKQFRLRINRTTGSSYHEHLHSKYTEVWNEIDEVFTNLDFPLGENSNARIKIQWEHCKKLKIQELKDEFLFQKGEKDYDFLSEEKNKFIDISCSMETNSNDMNILLSYYFENFLYYLFITMNISAPGSFSINTVIEKNKRNVPIKELSCEMFEYSFLDSIRQDWPKIKKISLSKTWEWILSHNIGLKQVANSRIERVLFSLINLCLERPDSPGSIVWLSRIIETLFDSPVFSINKVLRDRVILLLGTDIIDIDKFKKQFNLFYDYRSKFVHGELNIALPSNNDILDDGMNSFFKSYDTVFSFGMTIVLATIQKMVLNDWKSIEFTETYRGVQ